MQKDIYIRDIIQEDVDELVALYDSVWPKTAGKNSGKTKWMLSVPNFHGVCAIDNEKIVGSRLAFPYNIYYKDTKIKTVQYGNSCVHEDYRRIGLFLKMNSLFVEKYFSKGNDLIFNISVDTSKMAYQKLGWIYVDALSKLTYIANFWRTLWKTKLNLKNLAGNVTYRKSVIPSLIDFDYKLLEIREIYFRQTANLHTYYDKDFFRWRLNSDSDISILRIENFGAVLYKIGDKNGLIVVTIGEILLYEYDKKNLKQMIKIIKKTLGVDLLEISITEQHPCFQFYRKSGFITNPLKKYSNLGVKVISDKMKQICLNPKNWALAGIDIDTF